MKAFQEIGQESYPLHTYLLSDDKSKMYGYKKDGKGVWLLVKHPYRFDSRRRKFVVVNDKLPKIDEPKVEVPKIEGKTWSVKGSKGDEYIITLTADHWKCSCPAFTYQKKSTCKHIDKIKETV